MIRGSLAIAVTVCLLSATAQAQVRHAAANPSHVNNVPNQGAMNSPIPGMPFNNPTNAPGMFGVAGGSLPLYSGAIAASGFYGMMGPMGMYGGPNWNAPYYQGGFGYSGFNNPMNQFNGNVGGFNNPMFQGNMNAGANFNNALMPNNLNPLGQGLVGSTKSDPSATATLNGTTGKPVKRGPRTNKSTTTKRRKR